ncbi:MAG: protocatechuate 3,4-dioxygenase [Gammaproteobacteria bacterium]|nr:MAG: protocatechuate 3,4-dioxygenase [Gammaproteobacteria bacterium]
MADIVAGFCLPHDPLMASSPKINEQAKADIVFEAFEDVNRRIQALDVDTVIVIGSDHYTNFGPHCLPQYLIAVGDADGPVEPWLGIERYPVPVDTALATHIMDFGFDHGFDWAVAKDITLDHGTMIPIHLAAKPQQTGIKSIPVYTAAGVEPLLRSRRAYEVGQMIGKAVATYDGATRVAILGTGGISHWVGTAEMGKVNESFDRLVLDKVMAGDVEALIAMSDEYLIETAGNGSLEIRNWIMAMGAVGATGAELICYEPIPEWICGMGVVDLKLSA